MKVAILADTNSGIHTPDETAGLFVLPMPVIVGENTYYEGENLSEEDLCRYIERGDRVTTSQPPIGLLIDKLDSLLGAGYDEVVYIPMSSSLSSSCNTAKMVAREYDGKVHVVDNRRISVTQKDSVMDALYLAKKKVSGKKIVRRLEEEGLNCTIYLSVSSLEQLKNGGRITSSAAAIATVLNIKPVLTFRGEKIDSYGKVRGSMYRAQLKMIDALHKDVDRRFSDIAPERIRIGVAGFGIEEEERDRWLELAANAFPEAQVRYDPLPASIGAHTGTGAYGIGVSVDMKK
ncbi:EDD domain protein, DegV family [Aedoeadaptatus nemausensis]|uniref:EDD domain protein, DegV family n=1 Tax=Aedoeadaptatus nemausensis TaxID=2582829 RepID=A0A6V6Y1C1_9FIRM|nr:DegV family protein [Peptoniphilus nemausensis]CAC9928608.1 EDD domain protein, DegV family [Peptoniphilus nemausensis]